MKLLFFALLMKRISSFIDFLPGYDASQSIIGLMRDVRRLGENIENGEEKGETRSPCLGIR